MSAEFTARCHIITYPKFLCKNNFPTGMVAYIQRIYFCIISVSNFFLEKCAEWIELKQYGHLWKDVADVCS